MLKTAEQDREQPVVGTAVLDNKSILVVDDEEPIRRMLSRLLERHGYACKVASDAIEARRQLEGQAFALILCDVNMPGESGLDLIRRVLREYPHTAAVMVTGLDDPQLAGIALEHGAYGYIVKPFESNEVLINVSNALRRRRLEIENQAHREHLEQTVLERTAALRQAITNLERAERDIRSSREETIQRLALAAEFRDDETARHVQRMSQYCALLARRYGLDADRCELIRIASPMHDIGKIGTPDNILLKPGKFTPEEFEAISRHPEIGYRILAGSEAELLRLAAIIAWTHHEKYDGSGYPRKLVGDAIPLEGRIAAIADAFDALTSRRVYKPAYPVDQAITLMRNGRGKHFDPGLLDTFLEAMSEVVIIKEQYADL
jgi:putative two-component system response regulator